LSRLQFKLASYDIEGNFLGFSDLADQLALCPVSPEGLKALTTIGRVTRSKCSFDLKKLTEPSLYPHNANVFYEMYLVDYNGDLIDVPIKIANQQPKNGGANEYPNQEPNMADWLLTRRFAMLDTLSGISGGVPTVVRYAKKVSLKIELDQEEPEKIYPPYLEVEYQEKRVADIKKSNLARFAQVEFIAENFMDPQGFWTFAESVFWTLCVILLLAVCIFVGISHKADRLATDATASSQLAAFRGITTALSLFSSFFFWYLFAMTAWWFVFYKL
jgi:meckelin